MVDCILGVKMYLVTEEKKSWRVGGFECHGRMLYVYCIRSEREKMLFKGGQYFETAEEVLNFLERTWKL